MAQIDLVALVINIQSYLRANQPSSKFNALQGNKKWFKRRQRQ